MQWMVNNKARSESLMETLLSAPARRFNQALELELPEKHGVYAISIESPTDLKFLWVGMTHRSKRGLRRRIWVDHFKNPTNTSDLPKVLLKTQVNWKLADAKRWISDNCTVRWIEVDDEDDRRFLEHYATALLRPDPKAGFR